MPCNCTQKFNQTTPNRYDDFCYHLCSFQNQGLFCSVLCAHLEYCHQVRSGQSRTRSQLEGNDTQAATEILSNQLPQWYQWSWLRVGSISNWDGEAARWMKNRLCWINELNNREVPTSSILAISINLLDQHCHWVATIIDVGRISTYQSR